MFAPKLVKVSAGAWVPVVAAGAGQANVINRDSQVTVLLGPEGADPAGSAVTPLDPLGFQLVDGGEDVWATTAAGTAQISVVPGGRGAQVGPRLTAQQRFSRNVGQAQNQVLAGGGGLNVVSGAAMSQLSLQCIFRAGLPANAGTNPFASVGFSWTDSASGLSDQDDLFFMSLSNGARNAVSLYVPIRADTLIVTLKNLDSAEPMSYDFTVTQTSHPVREAFILESLAVPVFGYTRPGGNPAAALIASIGAAIAPGVGNALFRLAAAYSGRARLSIDNTGQANSVYVTISDPANIYGMTGFKQFASMVVAAGQQDNLTVVLPKGPVLIQAQNLGATGNITPSITLTGESY